MRAKPEYYREQARRTRELAAKTRDKSLSANLLEVAERYDALAVSTENERDLDKPHDE